MNTFYRRALNLLAAIIAISVMITATFAYVVRSVDLDEGLTYDGLGRLLSEPPLWASVFVTREPVWAGLGWHLLDILWFFGGLYLAFQLHDKASEDS
jgi:hypothetical protein